MKCDIARFRRRAKHFLLNIELASKTCFLNVCLGRGFHKLCKITFSEVLISRGAKMKPNVSTVCFFHAFKFRYFPRTFRFEHFENMAQSLTKYPSSSGVLDFPIFRQFKDVHKNETVCKFRLQRVAFYLSEKCNDTPELSFANFVLMVHGNSTMKY